MSTFDFTSATEWAGRPVARRVADAAPRARLVATGVVAATDTVKTDHTLSYVCEVDDGTGSLDVVFLGRDHVGGLVAGARVTVEGVARAEGGRLVVWNPLYRIERPADGPG